MLSKLILCRCAGLDGIGTAAGLRTAYTYTDTDQTCTSRASFAERLRRVELSDACRCTHTALEALICLRIQSTCAHDIAPCKGTKVW